MTDKIVRNVFSRPFDNLKSHYVVGRRLIADEWLLGGVFCATWVIGWITWNSVRSSAPNRPKRGLFFLRSPDLPYSLRGPCRCRALWVGWCGVDFTVTGGEIRTGRFEPGYRVRVTVVAARVLRGAGRGNLERFLPTTTPPWAHDRQDQAGRPSVTGSRSCIADWQAAAEQTVVGSSVWARCR